MTIPRRATPDDAPELMRLRAVTLGAVAGPWQSAGAPVLRRLLSGETLAAYVIDAPDAPGLAACVAGAIDERIPGPNDPHGLRGYVYNVATGDAYRRRGFSRACMTALLDWYARRGVTVVDLRASADGLPLYESLGFRRTADPAMRLYLTRGSSSTVDG